VGVTPSSASLAIGDTLTLAAATFTADSTPLTGRVITWQNSNGTAAVLLKAGGDEVQLVALAAGDAAVTAESEGVSGLANVVVRERPVREVFFVEDFQRYTSTEDLRIEREHWNEDRVLSSSSLFYLDTTMGIPELGIKQTMRYEQVDRRIAAADPCTNTTITRELRWDAIGLPALAEVWIEVWVRFSPQWKTFWYDDYVAAGIACINSASQKLIFFRPLNSLGGRWDFDVGVFGGTWLFGNRFEDGGAVTSSFCRLPHSWFNDRWQRIRFHLRGASASGTKDGVYAWTISAPDGQDAASTPCAGWTFPQSVAIGEVNGGFVGMALGANMNRGPLQTQSYWWGPITVFDTNPGWGF
jgi:hypothetical protein